MIRICSRDRLSNRDGTSAVARRERIILVAVAIAFPHPWIITVFGSPAVDHGLDPALGPGGKRVSRQHPKAGAGEVQIPSGDTDRDCGGADDPHLWLIADLADGTDQPHWPAIALIIHLGGDFVVSPLDSGRFAIPIHRRSTDGSILWLLQAT
ncbi:hypothetical protein SB4_07505 [Sphingomonas sanguinis]|uniref:Uncharacterized protein n=1 Tax=Sphingomonas sanguinis TaxID=33051 RepID=A0A147IWR9_9SPHN|nr:hypothetical protein SB4_07505 [Sphingomonas sanguinis]